MFSWETVLKRLYRNVEVALVKVISAGIDITEKDLKEFSESTYIIWIDNDRSDLDVDINEKIHMFKEKIVRVPSIFFYGFHQDAGYAYLGNRILKNGLGGDWNSIILLEGFLLQKSPEMLASFLHNDYESEDEIKNNWIKSKEYLQSQFTKTGWNFERWWFEVLHGKTFMYGINHPTLSAINTLVYQFAEQAKLVARYDYKQSIDLIEDPLAHSVWPIYGKTSEILGIDPREILKHNSQLYSIAEFINCTIYKWQDEDFKTAKIQKFFSVSPNIEQIRRIA